MATSENVEMTRDEHHDLLPNSSGDVGNEKEKWVEKGEDDDDCKWEEDGWEEEAEEEEWEWEGEKAAKELFDKGSKAIEEEQFVHAECCFHDVLESRLEFLSLPHAALTPKPG